MNHLKSVHFFYFLLVKDQQVVLTLRWSSHFGQHIWPRGGGCHPPLEILIIACLTFCLLMTDRPTLGLPEYRLKVVNICKMHGTGGLEVVVLCAF